MKLYNNMMAPFLFEGDIFKRMDQFLRDSRVSPYRGTEPYDIYKQDDSFIIEFALVGLDAEDINVSVSGQTLKIEAEAKQNDEASEVYHKKISRRSVKKHFTLHDTIDKDSIEAEYKSGLLRVKLPLEKEERKDIMIKVK